MRPVLRSHGAPRGRNAKAIDSRRPATKSKGKAGVRKSAKTNPGKGASRTATKTARKGGKAPARGGPPQATYTEWTALVRRMAGRHDRLLAYSGAQATEAWTSGQSPEAFALSLPTMKASSTRGADLSAQASPASGLPSRSTAPSLSMVTDSTKPYRVRASCGHIVVRKMRESTAGVPYSEAVVLDAPQGRACDACEAKKDYGAHAPNPKPKGNFKAPELRDTAEVAKRIRAEIVEAVKKKALPKAKYEVRTEKYSTGSSISVTISGLPSPILNKDAFHVAKGANEISFNRDKWKSRYTPEVDRVLAKVNAIVDSYHWDRSDLSTDYYNERFARYVRVDEGSEWTSLNARRATMLHEGAKP